MNHFVWHATHSCILFFLDRGSIYFSFMLGLYSLSVCCFHCLARMDICRLLRNNITKSIAIMMVIEIKQTYIQIQSQSSWTDVYRCWCQRASLSRLTSRSRIILRRLHTKLHICLLTTNTIEHPKAHICAICAFPVTITLPSMQKNKTHTHRLFMPHMLV